MNRLDFLKKLGTVAASSVAFYNYKGEKIASTEEKQKLILSSEKSDADHRFAFRTDGYCRLHISSSGNVGMSTTSPSIKWVIS